MKTLISADAGRFSDALRAAFPSPDALEQLLITPPLEKSFIDYASKEIGLKYSSFDICKAAIAEEWGLPLLEVARSQSDNPVLRAFWESLAESDPAAVVPVPRRIDPPSLTCGRGDQWNQVCQIGPTRQHVLILVAGRQGQAPEHFQERIRVFLTPQPGIVRIGWPTRPASKAEFFECLEEGLKPDRTSLKEAIADRLRTKNLLLLHDCLEVDFDDENLVKYYTEWLPELLDGKVHNGRFKCVQPIEWQEPAAGSFLRRLFSGRQPGANDHEGALSLITALEEKTPPPVIQAIRLPELDLTDGDVQTFLKSTLTLPQQKKMLNELETVPKIPKMIFKTIDACWSRVQAAS